MKTIILGNGFVASHLNKNYEIVPHKVYSVLDIEEVVHCYQPTTIINCIGYGGSKNIDDCEENKTKTYKANTILPLIVADVCRKHKIHMIHISSGCIFYGPSPNKKEVKVFHEDLPRNLAPTYCSLNLVDAGWKETDLTFPESFYSQTKYASDLVLSQLQDTTILRIRMPVSHMPNPRNIITKISKYDQLLSAKNSLTFLDDFSLIIDYFVDNRVLGVYHVTNPTPLSPVDIMNEYKKYNPSHSFIEITEDQLDKLVVAKRSTCIINSDKLNSLGLTLKDSKEALEKTMYHYCKGTNV